MFVCGLEQKSNFSEKVKIFYEIVLESDKSEYYAPFIAKKKLNFSSLK